MSEVMNKKQSTAHTTSHNGVHEEDNCDGCQEQRRQNNRLVEFYERLHKIENKVDRIRQGVGVQKDVDVCNKIKIDKMGAVLIKPPDQNIELIKQQNSKQMGYELASALIERELKTKMQNQRLQQVIQKLQRDKLRLQQQKRQSQLTHSRPTMYNSMSNPESHSQHYHKSQTARYSDVLDEVRKTHSIVDSTFSSGKKEKKEVNNYYFLEKEQSKRYWDNDEGQSETSFSHFSTPGNKEDKKKTAQKNPYQGLNLWLYQYKAEDVDQNPIKALRKPNKKAKQNIESRYKSKY